MVEFDFVFNVLEHVNKKQVLLVFNKTDTCFESGDKQFIEDMFNLSFLLDQYPNLNLIYTSALTGTACNDVYLWVSNVVTGKNQTDHKKKNACGCLF